MDIIQIAGLGFVTTILIVMLKPQRPELTIQISILFGIMIITLLVGKLKAIIDVLDAYIQRADINGAYIKSLIKVIGIAYITQFSAEICRDAEQNAIASKVELAGKVLIMVIAVPIVTSVLELILSML